MTVIGTSQQVGLILWWAVLQTWLDRSHDSWIYHAESPKFVLGFLFDDFPLNVVPACSREPNQEPPPKKKTLTWMHSQRLIATAEMLRLPPMNLTARHTIFAIWPCQINEPIIHQMLEKAWHALMKQSSKQPFSYVPSLPLSTISLRCGPTSDRSRCGHKRLKSCCPSVAEISSDQPFSQRLNWGTRYLHECNDWYHLDIARHCWMVATDYGRTRP